ncbi:antitoxin of toxin-antitoxin stability system [Lactobacillus sp. LL6]|uniref:type II toxin-antitoxin system PemI/MazE family antitoxin n=1 Tax=Lactobacillus sp. LL6 TaxID=2596827 RepID=UPI001186F90F|nr:antitoxin of toxin-antitoxin stability system [Lactobacillus sp. LL6]TSO25371.1 antitoxin of toxin-antitoxin stability system [Lactobacillus sp. LL6]
MAVKIRKVGNSQVLTVPKSISVASGTEYEVFAGRNGAITFLPIESNPFHSIATLKKYGKFNGDTKGFIDAEIDNDEI